MDFEKIENGFILKENENVLAEINFVKTNENEYTIYHTFVDDSLRGQGIASKLVQLAVDEINARGAKVKATCSYAKGWLEKRGLQYE